MRPRTACISRRASCCIAWARDGGTTFPARTSSCPSRSSRWACAESWCGWVPPWTTSCTGTTIRRRVRPPGRGGGLDRHAGRHAEVRRQVHPPDQDRWSGGHDRGGLCLSRQVRGYARFDAARVAALTAPTQADLLGNGYLAMTVDQGPDMERYQGIVPLHGEDLTAAAHGYFEKSEQIPTRIRMAAGPLMQRGAKAESWRAGAIMVQHLPREGGASPLPSPVRRCAGRHGGIAAGKRRLGEGAAAARHGRGP